MTKKKPKKHRNPNAIAAKKRKGGVMRNKKDKRKTGKNKQKEFLEEDY